ncbi:tetratricopeptide repeat protein, partial [candidate division KSB1 bacterium]
VFFTVIFIFAAAQNIHAQTARECYEQGLALKQAGDIDGAIGMFDKARKKDRDFADANYELALCYMSQGTIRGKILAEYALDRALSKEPENTSYFLALAQLKIMQDLRRDPIDILNKLLEIDPEHLEARYLLAQLYAEAGWDQNVTKAEILLNELAELAPGYKNLAFSLGEMYYEKEEYALAEDHLLKHLELSPGHAEAKLLLGQTCYHLNDHEKATEYYLEGLEETTDARTLKGIHTDMTWLFEDNERSEYSSTPYSFRGKYLADYWRRYEVNIMTKANERLIEHLRRVEYVNEHYHAPSHFGRDYDDRGMIYLQYGEPDNSHKSVSIGFNYNPIDGSYDTLHGGDGFHSNESWIYRTSPYELAFDFMNTEIGSYQIVQGLPPSEYIDRGYLGGIYARLAAAAFAGGADFERVQYDVIMDKTKAEADAPRQKYVLEFEEEPISFFWSAAQFRGWGDETDVELYLGLPHEQLEFTEEPEGFSAEVESQVAIIDSTLVRQVDRAYPLFVSVTKVDRSKALLTKEVIGLVPGEYRFGIQMKQENANKLGIYQPEVTVRDFSGSELMVSDIKLSAERPGRTIPVIRSREELDLQPYPFPFVSKEQPLVLYFEVYNLMLDPDDRTSYSLTYTVEPAPAEAPAVESLINKLGRFLTGKRRASISITQERAGTGRTAYELIYADISDIPEMDALITVTVHDKTGGKTAESTQEIKIID